MTTAAFKARNVTTSGAWSLFADGGFDAAPGDVIELQLEGSPASDIWLTVFSCVGRSKDRSAPVFTPSTGIAATPTGAVTFTMPAGERGTWAIQCQTNDGEIVDGDATINTRSRYFAARTVTLDLRHPLPAETVEYEADGWAVALQELEDAVDAFAAGGSGVSLASTAPANIGTTAAVGVGTTAARADHVHALTEAIVRTVLAGLTANPSFNAKKLTSIANGSASDDAAAFGQIATAVNAAVAGTANTLQKSNGSHALADAGITDDGTTIAIPSSAARVFAINRDSIGTTKTIGVDIGNDTASGSQVSPQVNEHAYHSGGTRHNFARQVEPQSASRAIWRECYGTGTTAPPNTLSYGDTSDPSFGVARCAPTFVATSGGNGHRLASNGGGVKEDGSTNAIFQNAAAGSKWQATSSTSTGNTGARFEFLCDAGTPTAGRAMRLGYGSGSFATELLGVSCATATMGHLFVNGVDLGWNVRTVAFADSPVTAAIGDRFLVDTTGGIVTINLPAVPSVTSARQLDVIVIDAKLNFGANRCVLAPNGTNKIDTVNASIALTTNGVGATLVHDGDGTNWWRV